MCEGTIEGMYGRRSWRRRGEDYSGAKARAHDRVNN